MILAIDIGNTSITMGQVNKGCVCKRIQIASKCPAGQLNRRLVAGLKSLARGTDKVDGVVVCSVVPSVLKRVTEAVLKVTGHKPKIIGKNIKVPLKNRYRQPRQVGQDRLVGAYAAWKLYGIPAVIVDLGTAITIDVVSRKMEYLGGIIVPGIRMSAETLFERTALLPHVAIAKPRNLIGKDTKTSILSGIFYGYGEMINGLISLVRRGIKGEAKVIVTGGYTKLMKPFISKHIDVIEEDLVLKGLDLLYRNRD